MNKKMDVVVSFDTTGSMYPCLTQVRREVENFVNDMFMEFKDLRIGIIAHGDYCDLDNPYTIKYRELSRDAVGLCRFIRDVEQTYGGDADECYELVLNLAHSKDIGWREDADKIFIMIGDASPHSPSYRDNKDNLDWREEAIELSKLGIKVFSVHALASLRSPSRNFYKKVASDTLGVYLTLEQFSEIIDLIKATVYQQSGEEKLNEFITIIKDSGRMTRTMSNNFKRLKGEEVPDEESYMYMRHTSRVTRTHKEDCEVTLKEMGGLVPVAPSRFQVMRVDENCDIRGFVESNGIEFKKGRGFYELTKAETVQQYKEVIMQDRETGEMFNGSQVREKLKLSPQSEKGGVNERLHAADAKEFRIFVQSTSVNRKLIAGTTFLYEIPDMEYTGTEIKDKPLPSVPEEVAKEMREAAEKTAKKSSKKSSKASAKKAEPKAEASVKEEVASVKEEAAVKEEEASVKEDEASVKEDVTPEDTDKTYVESVEFSDMAETVDIVAATNKELDDMLKGKDNTLTERLTGVETLHEDTSKKELDPASDKETDKTPEEESEKNSDDVTSEKTDEADSVDKARSEFVSLLNKYIAESCQHIEDAKSELHALVDAYIDAELNRARGIKITEAYRAEDRVDKVIKILKAVLS